MKGDVSLVKLTSNVSIILGVMNFLIGAILCNNSDMVLEKNKYFIHDVTPTKYDIKLTVHQTEQREECSIYFNGECDIEFIVNVPLFNITLNAERSNINITSISLLETNNKKEESNITIHISHDFGINFLLIHFTKQLFGRNVLRLHYNSCLSDADAFTVSYKNDTKVSLIATHLLPTRGRALLPCFDDLTLKAHFDITLFFNQYYNATSNGATKSDSISYATRRKSFAQVSNITTYDIAILIFMYDLFTYTNGTDVQDKTDLIWYRSNMVPEVENHIKEFVRTIVVKITKYILNNWDSLYTFLPARTYVIPGFPHDAVTKPGLNIYREEALLYKKGTDSFMTKIGVSRLIARTTAHGILSRLVRPISWNHLWINEGIAMLLGLHIINQSFPELRLFDLFMVQFHQESLRLDVENTIGPVMPIIENGTNINSLFSFSHYIKAPVILNVLRRGISDEVFWKGVQNYFTNNTETDFEIFCDTLESAVKETNVGDDIQLSRISLVMETWANQTHYHVLNVTQKENSSQIYIRTNRNTGIPFDHLLLTMTTQSNLNFKLNSQQIYPAWIETGGEYAFSYLKNQKKEDWIMFNSQQLGYYRIMYEDRNWRKIARYMSFDNYTDIPVLNRAQIMDDAFYFLTTNQMDLRIFLNLINYLSREKDYVAWYPVFKGFEYISGYLPYEDSTFIKERFLIPLDKFFLTIRYSPTIVDTSICNFLRQEISKWACIFGSAECRQFSTLILIGELQDNSLPSWKDWKYCKGLMEADPGTWNQIFDLFLLENKTEMYRYLACSQSSNIINDYMELIANNTEIRNIIKSKGIKTFINIFHSIFERHAKTFAVLEFILHYFDYLIPRQIGTIVALTDIINHIYMIQHLDKVRDFTKWLTNPQIAQLLTKKILLRITQINNQEQRFSNLRRTEVITENDYSIQ